MIVAQALTGPYGRPHKHPGSESCHIIEGEMDIVVFGGFWRAIASPLAISYGQRAFGLYVHIGCVLRNRLAQFT